MEPFRTELLDAVRARRQADGEAQRLATLERIIQWLTTEGSRYGINEAFIFGSVIRPYHFTERSDVDVAVEQMGVEAFFEAMGKLSEAVERDVDLVELLRCPFAHRIREQGVVWRRETLPS